MNGFLAEVREYLRATLGAARRNPIGAALLFAVAAIIIYFFGFAPLYGSRTEAIWKWAWERFLPQYNQEHSKLIPLIILGLVWYHRAALRRAEKTGSNLGLLFLGIGGLLYLVAARALQPRVALFGFPFLIYGAVMFLWGKQVARILRFPIALLFFMIPLGAIEQMTFKLQFIIVAAVRILSRLCGIGIYTIGTSVHPVSGNWGFDISEGCSGIRSLIAMVMLTAVYVHIWEPKVWKKVTILAFSTLFAIIGNAGRIFTIIVLAKLGYPKFAGGIYHDWSSQLIFFPIALLSMVAFHKLLNLNLGRKSSAEIPKPKEVPAYDY
jgi:exosortase